MEDSYTDKRDWRFKHNRSLYIFAGIFIISIVYIFLYRTPEEFPLGQVISIESGDSLQGITNTLQDSNVIKSPFIFRTHVILLGGEKRVIAGDYLLDKKEGPLSLANRLVNGEFHIEVVRATIPEGWNIYEIGDYLEKTLLSFNKIEFLKLVKKKEGYLFPDTYFIARSTKSEMIVERMNKNFFEKILTIGGVATSTHSLEDIITMASIIEDEARTPESRRIIAGILWKRLALGMPLQVDATFSYINGKGTFELTSDDLKIDSPYNTYRYKGLPPGPINNPGVDAIISAVNPTTTKYLYFLSSKSGEMYYAKTFEEHKRNRELYLNK